MDTLQGSSLPDHPWRWAILLLMSRAGRGIRDAWLVSSGPQASPWVSLLHLPSEFLRVFDPLKSLKSRKKPFYSISTLKIVKAASVIVNYSFPLFVPLKIRIIHCSLSSDLN